MATILRRRSNIWSKLARSVGAATTTASTLTKALSFTSPTGMHVGVYARVNSEQ